MMRFGVQLIPFTGGALAEAVTGVAVAVLLSKDLPRPVLVYTVKPVP